jgi:hypothetical protein
MKYIKFSDEESDIRERTVWYELDEEFYCHRAVYEEPDKIKATHIAEENYLYALPEGSLKEAEEWLGEEVSEIEFESKWQEALKPFRKEWERIKNNYSVGQNIPVEINCFYPQGIILDFGEILQGMADYQECVEIYGGAHMYPRKGMKMQIKDFDDKNLQVIMKPVNNGSS